MSEYTHHGSRLMVAARMNGSLADDNPAVMFDRQHGEFVMDLTSRIYISKPLADVEPDDRNDMSVYWRFVVPSRRRPDVLEKVEFGLPPSMIDSEDVAKSDIENAVAIDEELGNHAPKLAIQGLFAVVGGEVVRRVTASGGIFFAGIERRQHRPDGSHSEPKHWSQLIYSKQLLKTGELLKRQIDMMKTSGFIIPSWMEEATNPDKRERVARMMALSALVGALEE